MDDKAVIPVGEPETHIETQTEITDLWFQHLDLCLATGPQLEDHWFSCVSHPKL